MKLFQKTLCLMCEKKCGKIYTTLKYRYEGGKIGEVYVCEECSKDYDVEDMKLNDEPL